MEQNQASSNREEEGGEEDCVTPDFQLQWSGWRTKKKKKLYPKFRLGIDAKDVTVSESKQVTAYLLVWMWPSAKRNFYIPENTTNVILTKVFSFF